MYTTLPTQCEILSEFYYNYADFPNEPSLGNDSLKPFFEQHRLAIAFSETYYAGLIDDEGVTPRGDEIVSNAFSALLQIVNVNEPTENPIGSRAFTTWAQFLDELERVNDGKLKRANEV
jgi:hypothetical protein